MLFQDRRDAGRKLAAKLTEYHAQNAVVLALPRGGVAIGREVADALALPLDVIIVRKIGAPGNPEYAIGAIAERGEPLIDEHIVGIYGISQQYLEDETAGQRIEIDRRRKLYRRGRSLPRLAGKTVILVDDGIATGFTMLAAIRAIQSEAPARIVVAVPVAPLQVIEQIGRHVDHFVCLSTPEPFIAVGRWYQQFTQVSDEVVRAYLEASPERLSAGGGEVEHWPLAPH